MKRPGFLNGVLAAGVLGIFASAFIAVLTPFVGVGVVTRLAIPLLALAYVLYLFGRNREKTGRVTTVVLWTGMSLFTWWISPPLPFYLLIHAGAVWLIRSLYFYSGVLPSLIDLGLTGLAIIASVWALARTGSVFMGTWCFFLVQALFSAIPRSIGARIEAEPLAGSDTFARARQQADAALQRLMSQ
jgi:hypothetical protein